MTDYELDDDFEIINLYASLEEYILNNKLYIYKKDKKEITFEKLGKLTRKMILITLGSIVISKTSSLFTEISMYNKYHNSENIKKTNNLIKSYCEEEKIEYVDILSEYDSLIEDTSSFYKDNLKISNPIEAYICYTSMIELGCFSKNSDYQYADADYEIRGNYGINIIDGNGVCRNNASFLTDILKSMGYEANTICCNLINTDHLKKNDTIVYDSKKIKQNSDFLDINVKFDTNESVNHAVTVVKYNGKIFILDPTNHGFFLKDNDSYVKYDFININIQSNIVLEEAVTTSFIEGYIDQTNFFKLSLDFKLKNISNIYDIDLNKVNDYYSKYFLNQKELDNNLYDSFYNKENQKIKKISYLIESIEKEEN